MLFRSVALCLDRHEPDVNRTGGSTRGQSAGSSSLCFQSAPTTAMAILKSSDEVYIVGNHGKGFTQASIALTVESHGG